MSKMAMWNEWATPDPAFCKEASNGRYKFTNIDAYWLIQQATARWGPMGSTWGLDPEHATFQAIQIDPVGLLIFNGVFYYPEGRFPIATDARLKGGDDACKKIMTNAISKSLSFLGLGAAVYLGKFDDSKFVSDAGIQHGGQNAFIETAIASTRMVDSVKALDTCQKRIDTMVAKGTITSQSAALVYEEIGIKRAELSTTPTKAKQ